MPQKQAQERINEENMSKFTIQSSTNLTYNNALGCSFRFWPDLNLSEAVILGFKRGNKKTLEVRVRGTINEGNAYIRAKNSKGERELDIIESYIEKFKGKKGKELLNFGFREDIS